MTILTGFGEKVLSSSCGESLWLVLGAEVILHSLFHRLGLRTAGGNCLVMGWMLGVLQLGQGGQGVPGLQILGLAGLLKVHRAEVLAPGLQVGGKTVQWEWTWMKVRALEAALLFKYMTDEN
jgi:hypothetical protein